MINIHNSYLQKFFGDLNNKSTKGPETKMSENPDVDNLSSDE